MTNLFSKHKVFLPLGLICNLPFVVFLRKLYLLNDEFASEIGRVILFQKATDNQPRHIVPKKK